MTDDRDICERLEDPNYDGAFFLRLDAAKEIRYLRYYVARLEGGLAKEEFEHAKTKIALQKVQEHSSKQALDIVTLGQEVGRLREALEFYAHAQNYVSRTGMYSPISKDGFGNIARAALAEKEEK